VSPLPTWMVDRWLQRLDQRPGEGILYWHILLSDHSEAVAMAKQAQERLVPFADGLHFTPLDRLHVTALVVGPTKEIDGGAIGEMAAEGHRRLQEIPPVHVEIGRVLYHPEAIMLAVEPASALSSVRDAVRAATIAATGHAGVEGDEVWVPHMTVAYSTSSRSAEPLIGALGRGLPRRRLLLDSLSLVDQVGPERSWDWREKATVRFGSRKGRTT
jgi:2'-5' RNA ligase